MPKGYRLGRRGLAVVRDRDRMGVVGSSFSTTSAYIVDDPKKVIVDFLLCRFDEPASQDEYRAVGGGVPGWEAGVLSGLNARIFSFALELLEAVADEMVNEGLLERTDLPQAGSDT